MLHTFDVCYLNQQKQVVLVSIHASGRDDAFKQVSNKPDCRKYHQAPNITSITQASPQPH